jgi:hypothetical protein
MFVTICVHARRRGLSGGIFGARTEADAFMRDVSKLQLR